MIPAFRALDSYLARQDDGGAVRRARRYFAGVWLVYDVIDTVAGAVEHARDWMPHRANLALLLTHAVLIACGVQLVRDRRPFVFGLVAVGARLVETHFYGLNDFFYYAILMLLMAHGDGGPFERGKKPLWVRHALLLQLGWVYFATATLKLSADWVSGGQLFARTGYLVRGFDWPYPPLLEQAFQSMHFCAVLACVAVSAEFLLAFVLMARRPYWLGITLVVGIHTFAMLVTNVWFFSVSNIVLVTLLLPRRSRPVEAVTAPQDVSSGHRAQ